MSERRHPDYLSTEEYEGGKFKISHAVWVNQDNATFVLSIFDNGRWVVKVRRVIPKWGKNNAISQTSSANHW